MMIAVSRHRRRRREPHSCRRGYAMETKRRRVLFGPLLYGTLVFACLSFVGLGCWSLWPRLQQSFEMRTYASELRGTSPLLAGRAAEKLTKAGPRAVPWLTDLARDPDARVRSLALSTLGNIRPLSEPAEGPGRGIAGHRRSRPMRGGRRLGPVRPRCADGGRWVGRGSRGQGHSGAIEGSTRPLADRGKASELASQVLLSLVAQPAVTRPPVRLDAVDVIGRIGGETEARRSHRLFR